MGKAHPVVRCAAEVELEWIGSYRGRRARKNSARWSYGDVRRGARHSESAGCSRAGADSSSASSSSSPASLGPEETLLCYGSPRPERPEPRLRGSGASGGGGVRWRCPAPVRAGSHVPVPSLPVPGSRNARSADRRGPARSVIPVHFRCADWILAPLKAPLGNNLGNRSLTVAAPTRVQSRDR